MGLAALPGGGAPGCLCVGPARRPRRCRPRAPPPGWLGPAGASSRHVARASLPKPNGLIINRLFEFDPLANVLAREVEGGYL